MFMDKDDIKKTEKSWPANIRAPLTRDEQILFMKTAKVRRLEYIKRVDSSEIYK